MPWRPLPLSYAVAVYPFQPSASPAELPLQIGDQLYVIEQGGKDGDWCRGYLVAPPSILSALAPGGTGASDARVFSGIFPRSCIEVREELGQADAVGEGVRPSGSSKPPAPVPMLKIGDESLTSTLEPLVDEISSCLREWYILHLPDLVLRRKYDVLETMSSITTRLDYARRQLLNDVLTLQERVGVRDQAVWDLVRGNRMLSGEVIVRDPQQHGRLLTDEDSAIDMARLQSTMSLLDNAPESKTNTTNLHHLLLEVKSVTGTEVDSTSLSLSLYQKGSDGSISAFSESFTSSASTTMKTLVADLGKRDIGADGKLFLVVKAIVSALPKSAPKVAAERPLSRNGTLRVQKDALSVRRRSSLMFGSKRRAERAQNNSNGRLTPRPSQRSSTPVIKEDPDDQPIQQDVGPPVPRTVALGLVDIASLLRTGKEEERSITLWSAAGPNDEGTSSPDEMLPDLLHSASGRYVMSTNVSKIQVLLVPYSSPDADTLIRTNPTSMHKIVKTQKMGFSEAPSRSRSDIYLTISKAKIFQGSHLSHPELGFAPITAVSLFNLQVTMEIRDAAGRRIEHCIFASSNSTGATAFRTNAAELDTAWDQTICLRIPSEKVPESHLILSVADAPEFPFALAWMPLWDKQAFIRDDKHSLVLHAYDKSTSSIVQGRGAYLSLPWDHATFSAGHDGVSASVASLEVATRLCSTEYSQDRVLVSVIYWKHQSSSQLLEILKKLVFVPEIEIVKQLNEVLDSLYAILEHKSGESKFEDLIFNDIVFVLGIVHDRRFNLRPLVEEYTEHHFHSPYAAPCLLRSFTRLLQSVADPQSARDMRALFKVGRQFIRLLMASESQRKLLSANTRGEEGYPNFKGDMQVVLFGLQMMMRSETAALVGSKTLLVQNFHSWLVELLVAYTKDEVIRIAIDFVDACNESTGKLVLYKLVLILNYIKLEQLWSDGKDWQILVTNCMRWLEPHWGPEPNNLTDDWREQVRMCCSVVAELTKRPTPLLHEVVPTIISTYCTIAAEQPTKKWTLSLLFSASYPFTTRPIDTTATFDETLLELSALMTSIFHINPQGDLKLDQEDLAAYVFNTLSVLRSLLSNDACPISWLSLHVSQHSSAIIVLTSLANILMNSFLPVPEQAEEFDMALWKAYLDTLLKVVSSPSLTLESFSEQKRRAVWKIAGDVRQSGADLLRQTWENLGWEATADDQRRYNVRRLGGYQVQYVPSLVGSVIELCLGMHEGLRRAAVEILQTMIVSEWELSEDLDLIETEIIGSLNAVLKSRSGAADGTGAVSNRNELLSRKLFIAELLGLFSTIAEQPDDALWIAIEELVATIEELIDLLTNTGDELELDDGDDVLGDDLETPATDNPNGRAPSTAGRPSTDLPDRSASRLDERKYGVQALECYKTLADEYERSGDYKRLAKTHRAIARIHEARASSRLAHAGTNGHGIADATGLENLDDVEED